MRLFIDQDALEPILRARAEELGAELRYRVECASLVAGRRRRHGHPARSRRRLRADGALAISGRRRRQPQPDPRAAGHRHARPRAAVEQHHDLLPRRGRPGAVARGARPGRQLRHQPGPARVLPARPDRQPRLPRRQPGRRHRAARDRGGLPATRRGRTSPRAIDRAARARAAARRHRGPGHPGGDRGRRDLARGRRQRRALPGRARVPGRRRRPHDAPQRRVRRQHRRAGRVQPRLEAGARAARASPGPSCSTPTTPSGARSAR